MMHTHFRTIFISDVHLGTRACQAEQLLNFLQQHRSDYLYLVGDIFDLERMQNRIQLNGVQRQIVELVLERAAAGVKVIYIPGNHDHWLRKFCGDKVMGVYFARHKVHQTADGRQLFVTHGDELDKTLSCAGWLRRAGDWANTTLLMTNGILNVLRRYCRQDYWSWSRYVKKRLPAVRNYLNKYEQAAAQALQRTHYDGYICGHIHFAKLTRLTEQRLYCNLGDWVESCTALTESHQGELQLCQWSQGVELIPSEAANILTTTQK